MFSKDLELSIASLFDKAHEANIQYITVEHLLLMILSDFEVKEFFKSQDIQIESLKQSLNDHLKNNVVAKIDQQKDAIALRSAIATEKLEKDSINKVMDKAEKITSNMDKITSNIIKPNGGL